MLILNETQTLFNVPELTAKWSRKPTPMKDNNKILSSRDAFDIMFSIYPEIDLYESFWVMLLSRNNFVKGISNISIGSAAGTVADPKKIFQTALLAHSHAVILIHNHPSGNTQPSKEDMNITQKCKNAGLFLELRVLDHLIITPQGTYYSFADEGNL